MNTIKLIETHLKSITEGAAGPIDWVEFCSAMDGCAYDVGGRVELKTHDSTKAVFAYIDEDVDTNDEGELSIVNGEIFCVCRAHNNDGCTVDSPEEAVAYMYGWDEYYGDDEDDD